MLSVLLLSIKEDSDAFLPRALFTEAALKPDIDFRPRIELVRLVTVREEEAVLVSATLLLEQFKEGVLLILIGSPGDLGRTQLSISKR